MKWLGYGFLLFFLLGSTGCGLVATALIGGGTASGNVQTSTRGIEELFLSEGEAPFMFRYAEDLLSQGRYREAVTAYYSCEMGAYTAALRNAARTRRMYVQELILAYENGTSIEPPPAIDNSNSLRMPPKVNYDDRSFYGKSEISVFSAHPTKLSPNQHYVRDEAAYHIYGYPSYPGDISPEQIRVPEPPRPIRN